MPELLDKVPLFYILNHTKTNSISYLAQLFDDGLGEENGKVSAGVAAVGVGDIFGVADQGLLEEVRHELLVVDERAQVLRLREEEAAKKYKSGHGVELHDGDWKIRK